MMLPKKRCLAPTLIFALVGFEPAFPQFSSYEACVFPEQAEEGWIQIESVHQAERFIENCWLVQTPIIVEQGPPVVGQRDFYRRELADMAGSAVWVLTWRMETDGPLAIGAVAPASVAAGGQSGILYHFTIGEDQLAFQRDPDIPIVVVDYEPSVHVFELRLQNDIDPPTFQFLMDGKIIDSGPALGPYPSKDSSIVFGTRAAIEGNMTRWDYIAMWNPNGQIPAVSEWGVVGMAALLLTTATLAFRRSRKSKPA